MVSCESTEFCGLCTAVSAGRRTWVLAVAFTPAAALAQDSTSSATKGSPAATAVSVPPTLDEEIANASSALTLAQGDSVPDAEQIKLLQTRLLDLTETRLARNQVEQFDAPMAAARVGAALAARRAALFPR